MFGLGFQEILLVLVIIFLLFGVKRIPEIGKGLGETMRELRKIRDDRKTGKEKVKEKEEEKNREKGKEEEKENQKRSLISEIKKEVEEIPGLKEAKEIKEAADKVRGITKFLK